ncbi:hypothetical protein SBA3_3010004 [Candidatus Sulfopaludibacter sp. SbA3]|nr:hypothetical protein SBA3_3010004 [Candidatus Sulfopaludibacter sp. SbA3]
MSAALEGYVTDSTGGLIADASITARDAATHQSRQLSTDAEGHFRFSELPAGTYEITVTQSGFGPYHHAPQNGMKNRRLVAPAVSPPVALADRRQDRRRYPVDGPVFQPLILYIGRSISIKTAHRKLLSALSVRFLFRPLPQALRLPGARRSGLAPRQPASRDREPARPQPG